MEDQLASLHCAKDLIKQIENEVSYVSRSSLIRRACRFIDDYLETVDEKAPDGK